ncbi:hypothetical protein L3Y19_gp074 [Gordonia phage Neville]|uniref:DUF6378 domain-containing protein n=1 Tax=Gordonia phage Neville TaxID=2301693 RepID=A0A385DY52_9CAUD|nr:hypothetical protein L3Y19_gp074 [Gordonia phage Neville]AXQ64443.1 hypothetical protein SEA_NEVILLE_74 [Gordonia phage Neville]
MSDLLKEADHIVSGDRAGDYGENSLPAIARLWSEHVGSEITARDVAWMMVLLKSVRDRHKEKRDNLVDAIGYIQLAEVNTTPEPVKPVASLGGFSVGDTVEVVKGAFKTKRERRGQVLGIANGFVEVSDPDEDNGHFPYFPNELAHVTE